MKKEVPNKFSSLVTQVVNQGLVRNSEGVALVTGGSRRIGRLTAEQLLAAGFSVALIDMRWWTTRGAAIQSELESMYAGKVTFIAADVTSEVSFQRAIGKVVEIFNGVDVVINTAGVACRELDIDTESTIMTDTESYNINGVFVGTRLGLKNMSLENGGRGGTVINLSSVSCYNQASQKGFLSVSGTKNFVNSLTRCYGNQAYLESSGVRVLSINPGTSGSGAILDVHHLGRQLLSVLREGRNGTVWCIANNQPAREIEDIFPPIRTELYRSRESSLSGSRVIFEYCTYC